MPGVNLPLKHKNSDLYLEFQESVFLFSFSERGLLHMNLYQPPDRATYSYLLHDYSTETKADNLESLTKALEK